MNWFSWLRLVKSRHDGAVAAGSEVPRNDVFVPSADVPDFLPWLLEGEPLHRSGMSSSEMHAVEAVKKMLTLPAIPQSLLPRATALIPQLIALMRESSLPQRAIAERVSKDAKLTAEVMRLANSPYYSSQEKVTTLMQAVTLIGSQGLQTAIARVVLKPLLQSAASAELVNLEERLWEHSEVMAQHAAALAPSAGLAGIDGYIAGLLYNTGWKVAFRSLEQTGIALDQSLSEQFAGNMAELTHRLFGLATKGWDITPAFTTFTADAREFGLSRSAHPMTKVLQSAQAISMGEISTGMSQTLPAPLL